MSYIKYILMSFILICSTQALAMKNYILIGDSIMAGVSPSKINGPTGNANQLASFHLMNEKNVNIRNISSPGLSLGHSDFSGWRDPKKVSDMLSTIGGIWSAYDGIIIQAGTNDFGRSVHWGDTVTTMRYILKNARYFGKKVMVMEPIWRRNQDQPNNLGFTLDAYRFFMYIVCMQEFPDICSYSSRNNSGLADANSAKYFDPNEVKTGTELHLNAAGHRAYANWIMLEAAKRGLF